MYLDYYKINIQLGLNYDVISTIKNSIIFNEKFLSQNNSNIIENENEFESEELILNIAIENSPSKFLNILSISEIDINNNNNETVNETDNDNNEEENSDIDINNGGITYISASKDKTKILVCLSVGIINIYQLNDFKLLNSINIKEKMKKIIAKLLLFLIKKET